MVRNCARIELGTRRSRNARSAATSERSRDTLAMSASSEARSIRCVTRSARASRPSRDTSTTRMRSAESAGAVRADDFCSEMTNRRHVRSLSRNVEPDGSAPCAASPAVTLTLSSPPKLVGSPATGPAWRTAAAARLARSAYRSTNSTNATRVRVWSDRSRSNRSRRRLASRTPSRIPVTASSTRRPSSLRTPSSALDTPTCRRSACSSIDCVYRRRQRSTRALRTANATCCRLSDSVDPSPTRYAPTGSHPSATSRPGSANTDVPTALGYRPMSRQPQSNSANWRSRKRSAPRHLLVGVHADHQRVARGVETSVAHRHRHRHIGAVGCRRGERCRSGHGEAVPRSAPAVVACRDLVENAESDDCVGTDDGECVCVFEQLRVLSTCRAGSRRQASRPTIGPACCPVGMS